LFAAGICGRVLVKADPEAPGTRTATAGSFDSLRQEGGLDGSQAPNRKHNMTSDRLARWVFLGLTILFVFFIVYASWTPGSERYDIGRRYFRGFEHPQTLLRVHSLRDIATNVLLYVPLGVFLALAVARRKARFLSPWIFVGTLVSVIMEVGQSFIGRHPDLVDIVTNSTGHVIGYWVIVAGVRFYGLDPVVFLGLDAGDKQDARTQSIAALRFIYICIYGLIALLPFDISVSLSKIYAKLFADEFGEVRIILDPLYHLSRWQQDGLKLTLELLGLVPIAALTAALQGIRGRLSVFPPIYTCLWVAVACEAAQVFILSRTTDIAMIPLAALAGVVGWALIKVWFDLQKVDTQRERTGEEANWRPLVVALIGYGLVILFLAWSPFQFETDPRAVARKILYESNLIPFKEHFTVRSLPTAIDIVKEAGIFIPFGILVSYLLVELIPAASRSRIVLLTGLVSLAFATLVELSQAVSIGRYIDVTDILLAGGGGMCGAVFLRLFRFGKTGPGPEG